MQKKDPTNRSGSPKFKLIHSYLSATNVRVVRLNWDDILIVNDWSFLFSPAESCEDLLSTFHGAIKTGLDLLMLVEKVCVNTSNT